MKQPATIDRMRRGSASPFGFTLLELVIILGVLAVVALIALPGGKATRPYSLDVATGEVANTIRFARTEAMRRAGPYGVHIETGAKRLRVFRGTGSGSSPTPVYDVLDPISKHLFALDLDDDAATAGVAMATSTSWSGSCNKPELLGFDAAGTPRCGDPWAVVLGTSTLTLSHAGQTRSIVVDGETGRVRVQ